MHTSKNISSVQLFGIFLFIAAFELLTYMASDLIMPAMLTVTKGVSSHPGAHR